ncbi:TIGR03767 family metallophosphoesterase [Streptomyces carminius]|uniref:TIGR03767 family metallophosphoesterase n=1 Tax=Streptomyces carminius TaxID=2665496 RepID=A0A2M8LQI4_9ACTN|nr:TIGR03767 family metallophosphoesterase [Streptomyces carminius]PJE94223.1 TIGR03767 family metallophosphoesterase [Streptomyces carminius]
MSRSRPESVTGRRPLTRRTLLTAAGVAGAAGATTGLGAVLHAGGESAGAATPAAPSAPSATAPTAPAPAPAPAGPSPAGTTLESVAAPRGTTGYRRLAAGPGWPRVVREELAPAGRRREEKRTVLLSFVHLTDAHLTDVQHPVRFEYLRAAEPRAWRPQEALTVHGLVSMVERINALRGGPATGAPLDFAMTTGDNTDNNCRAEVEWFLTAMSGGRITPNTGDPGGYEGVQDSGLPLYWHPEKPLDGIDRRHGLPHLPGLLGAATGRLTSPGLGIPWYSTVGNHDNLVGGHYAVDPYFAELAVGDRKLYELPAAEAAAMRASISAGTDTRGSALRRLLRGHARRTRTVTPDPARVPLTNRQYAEAHLDPAYTGPGPAGHGYTAESVAEGRLYYSFRAPGNASGNTVGSTAGNVVGISLDTTNPDGDHRGHLAAPQLRWLDRELARHRDDHVLVFSHHPAASTPVGGDALLAVLARHPNVVAWLNGHSHRNRITPRGHFWEITTASHVDHPQLARVVELTDNGDGTLSLFTTCVESAAPYAAEPGDLSPAALASRYRELAFNAPGRLDILAGEPDDRNTELLLRRR